uniref:hypothetical protein n=1 Tax=Nonomuraea sp. CA-252377 TaxID=3240003 RepID=UPI003F495D57
MVEQFGSFGIPPLEGVASVADAVRQPEGEDYMPRPAPEDVDDALLLVPGARRRLLEYELDIIEAARANDRSWELIAERLGVSVTAAKARPAKLRRAIDDLGML